MAAMLPRLTITACLLCPSLTWALGLGEIHLNSALNQPLNADIDLIAATPDELAALRADLAGRDAFTRYGIDRPPFLSSLTFKVAKAKDGHDVLAVRSSEAIPEPFVTFLVEVNWSRGRLMREYTVLLDPPVYTPGDTAAAAAPVAAPTTQPPRPLAPAPPEATRLEAPESKPAAPAVMPAAAGTYRVAKGDTLSGIAHTLRPGGPAEIDQTMIALYRANSQAFDGNINLLRRGAILRVPGADEIAALNQTEAIGEVRRQMSAWRGGATTNGHLRLVTPGNGTAPGGGGTPGTAETTPAAVDSAALNGQIKDLQSKLDQSRRALEVSNAELAALQLKLGKAAAPAPATAAAPAPATVTATAPPPAVVPPAVTPTPPASPQTAAPTAPPPSAPAAAAAATGGNPSVLDWLADNWWAPAAAIVALLAGLGFAAWKRRQQEEDIGDFATMAATGVSDEVRDPTAKLMALRAKGRDPTFVVEESGSHKVPEFAPPAARAGDVVEAKESSPDDTLSSESAVNLDQGDPLAEADFHMAYGLYDQAADLVRIALEREPERRDLKLKLLEIYFVWGNKDMFLQTAKSLQATRDQAPAGEWDKIVIMGRQICPEDPLFAASAGSGRGAGALVDLNLEGGENRVDIDLFGDPEGERSSLDHSIAKEADETLSMGDSRLKTGSGLDFTLDAPERGADESPTQAMPPHDEPTVESELMNFHDVPTTESPMVVPGDVRGRISSKLGQVGTDQTAEVSLDDLGLDLDGLDEHGSHANVPQLEVTDHPSEAPTMIAGMDERSRRMMADAESRSRDRDLTEIERELEASFISELETSQDDIKTAIIGPDSAPTVQMPRELPKDAPREFDTGSTSRLKGAQFVDPQDAGRGDIDSTSKLREIGADSVDLDLDRLANALGAGDAAPGDTQEQPRAAEDVFSTEVFEASQRSRVVDLDVGEPLNGADVGTVGTGSATSDTTKLKRTELALPELEPVTMSEVGTKLDLARAYMDMGDPEGARSILEEVVQEGSASQKQEAQRLIESLPG
jgi:pilus assembly protein FimV